jgi:hypothetical protein
MSVKQIRQVLSRIAAVFMASSLGVIGAGTIAGVEMSKAILMAGIGGVATVVEGLSRAYLADGKLSQEEMDAVFSKANDDATT